MASNNITGDNLVSKVGTKEQKDKFDAGYDRIFGKKKKYSEDWQDADRDKAIAQNGNTGEHYNQHGSCPKCGMDFNGDLIWDTFFKQYGDEAKADEAAGHYGATRTEGGWGKKVALYDMDRDRTVAWLCPQCKHEWSAR